MKARKPGPFLFRGGYLAWCASYERFGRVIHSVDLHHIDGRTATHLTRWLTRAAAWVKEGDQ